MKRLLGATLLLFALSALAGATSIGIGLSPNDGSGDNFGFGLRGPGFVLGGEGGVPYDFYNVEHNYLPGSVFGGETDTFFSSGFLETKTQFYTVNWDPGTLTVSDFTFPPNGKPFTVAVVLSITASGIVADTGMPISASGSERGHMSFAYDRDAGAYYAVGGFTSVPEPQTLMLFAIGLFGIAAKVRKQVKAECANPPWNCPIQVKRWLDWATPRNLM